MARNDGRRLSWWRLTTLLTIVAALVFAGTSGWRHVQDTRVASDGNAWYAGYVDATVTPLHKFEQPTSSATKDVILSFIVADPADDCSPSWGAAYSLDIASRDLDLDRRIARLRQNEGSVVVSFGGAINAELATVCSDPEALLEAYRSVVDRYDLRTIDLDIEGPGLSDPAATRRRAIAMKWLQDERKEAGKDLRVWLTLPATPAGLTTEGKDAVSVMLREQVDLSGVNLMTMDYGPSRADGQSMLQASTEALTATHRQLGQIYAREGQDVGQATLWRRLGATPMIGQNDVAGEIFTLDDARKLSAFARDKGLGRVSMWSVNRDRTCGENYPDVAIVSNSCSGVVQGDLTFAEMLRGAMTGRPDATQVAPVVPDSTVGGRKNAVVSLTDDPASSPYPIWDEDETYVEGTRTVWHRNAYVAKWWTQGDIPDDPVVDEDSSPWTLIGPVLPGEKPVVLPTLPKGTYPTWAKDVAYQKGERVMLDGTPFSAKWYSSGIRPNARSTVDDPSPWRRLTDAELRKAAKAAAS